MEPLRLQQGHADYNQRCRLRLCHFRGTRYVATNLQGVHVLCAGKKQHGILSNLYAAALAVHCQQEAAWRANLSMCTNCIGQYYEKQNTVLQQYKQL